MGFKVLTKPMGVPFMLKCLSCCVPEAAGFIRKANKKYTVDNSPAKDVLGIEFKDVKVSIIEMTDHLIKTGFIQKGAKK